MADAPRHFDYDLAIIGGGSGGYTAARTAAREGVKTVVIEGGEEVGGLCILRGCMPTKALLYAAEVMHLASHPQPWGIRAEDVSFSFREVMARKDRLIKGFAEYRQQELLSGKFEFVRGRARFTDAQTLELSLPGTPASSRGHSSKMRAASADAAAARKLQATPIRCSPETLRS